MGFYTRLYIMYSIYNDKLYITITIQHYLYTCSISICLRFDCWSQYMRFSCCGIHKTHREWLWNQTHLLHSNLHLSHYLMVLGACWLGLVAYFLDCLKQTHATLSHIFNVAEAPPGMLC